MLSLLASLLMKIFSEARFILLLPLLWWKKEMNDPAEANDMIQPSQSLFVAAVSSTIFCGEFIWLTCGLIGRLLNIQEDHILLHHWPIPPEDLIKKGSGIAGINEQIVNHVETLELSQTISSISFIFHAKLTNASFIQYFRNEGGALEATAERFLRALSEHRTGHILGYHIWLLGASTTPVNQGSPLKANFSVSQQET